MKDYQSKEVLNKYFEEHISLKWKATQHYFLFL